MKSLKINLYVLFSYYDWAGMGFGTVNGNHPGIAIGSQGDVSSCDKTTFLHLRDARDISQRTIYFDSLK